MEYIAYVHEYTKRRHTPELLKKIIMKYFYRKAEKKI